MSQSRIILASNSPERTVRLLPLQIIAFNRRSSSNLRHYVIFVAMSRSREYLESSLCFLAFYAANSRLQPSFVIHG
jgi:hypothetical protein